MEQLQNQLQQWANAYYTLDKPLVSDFEYDAVMQELIQLENEYPQYKDKNSITNKVGYEILDKFIKENHQEKMLSLGNAYSYDELRLFEKKVLNEINEVEWVVELKIDGLAISLVYENYTLSKAITRGDGFVGENVTHNIKTIKSIPRKINLESLTVRGEVYLEKNTLAQLNEQRMKNNEELLVNCRNAAAGAVRQLDANKAAERNLQAFLYYVVDGDQLCATHEDVLKLLQHEQFEVNPYYKKLSSMNEVINYIDEIAAIKHTLPYDIDGMVIKVNNISHQKQLGETIKVPKWAIAYKFPAEEVTTILEDITLTVGRTGKITPNAKLKTVFLAGSNVRAAQLHNYDYIREKDIRIHDTVVIRKAGEIIPEVVKVDLSQRTNQIPYEMPSRCPNCDCELTQFENEVDYYCVNSECPARIVQSLIHFASKPAMNIDGMGEKIVEYFYELGLLKSIEDIYKLYLKRDQLIQLPGFKEKSIDNLLTAIENSKKRAFHQLIYALGIKHIGEKSARTLVGHYCNIDDLLIADFETLAAIPDFGSIKADSVIQFFTNIHNREMITKLKQFNVNMTHTKVAIQQSAFTNKTIVITGTFEKMSRKEIENHLTMLGAKVSSSVSAKTNLVIYGENAGSKLTKAQQLNVAVMDEKQFYQEIEL